MIHLSEAIVSVNKKPKQIGKPFREIKVGDKIYYKFSDMDKYGFVCGSVTEITNDEQGKVIRCKSESDFSSTIPYIISRFVIHPENIKDAIFTDDDSIVNKYENGEIYVYGPDTTTVERLFNKYHK